MNPASGPISLIRPFWSKLVPSSGVFVVVLFVALGTLRAYGMLGPSSARVWVMVAFLAMCFLPWIFFHREGRRSMGLSRPRQGSAYLAGALVGVIVGLLLFATGYSLYGLGEGNWFISVRDLYLERPLPPDWGPGTLFIVFTIPAITFSPIGEELFFRGMMDEVVSRREGHRVAAWLNSAAFAGMHLLHHGWIRDETGTRFLPASATLWFFLMVGVGLLFTELRRKSGSVWPSVLAHATTNLIMNATIFFLLL